LVVVIFINDIDEAVETMEITRKSTDDITRVQTMVTSTDEDKLQEALNDLCRWAAKWGVERKVMVTDLRKPE
jgi:hypothetical protein